MINCFIKNNLVVLLRRRGKPEKLQRQGAGGDAALQFSTTWPRRRGFPCCAVVLGQRFWQKILKGVGLRFLFVVMNPFCRMNEQQNSEKLLYQFKLIYSVPLMVEIDGHAYNHANTERQPALNVGRDDDVLCHYSLQQCGMVCPS